MLYRLYGTADQSLSTTPDYGGTIQSPGGWGGGCCIFEINNFERTLREINYFKNCSTLPCNNI